MEKRNKRPVLETVFYIVAAILCLYSFYMLFDSYTYVSEYATMYGTTVSEMGSDAIQYVCSAFLPFFAYAVTIFGIGAIYAAVVTKNVVGKEVEVIEPAKEECECSYCYEEKEKATVETTKAETETECACEGECTCEAETEAKCDCEETNETAAELDEKYKFNPSER